MPYVNNTVFKTNYKTTLSGYPTDNASTFAYDFQFSANRAQLAMYNAKQANPTTYPYVSISSSPQGVNNGFGAISYNTLPSYENLKMINRNT